MKIAEKAAVEDIMCVKTRTRSDKITKYTAKWMVSNAKGTQKARKNPVNSQLQYLVWYLAMMVLRSGQCQP